MKYDREKFYLTIYVKRRSLLVVAILCILGSWAIAIGYKSPLFLGIGLAIAIVILIILGNALKVGESHVSEANSSKQTPTGDEGEGNN